MTTKLTKQYAGCYEAVARNKTFQVFKDESAEEFFRWVVAAPPEEPEGENYFRTLGEARRYLETLSGKQ